MTIRSILSRQMIPKLAWLGIVILSTGSAHARAQFQYSYIEAAYVLGEIGLADSDLRINGYRFTSQFDLSSRFVGGVKYSALEGKDTLLGAGGSNTISFDGSGVEVYGFYYSALGVQTDFLLGAGIDRRNFDVSSPGDNTQVQKNSDTKVLLAGIHQRILGLEIEARWTYNLDADPLEDEWRYTIGVLSSQPSGLQLGVQFSPDDTGDLLSISLRQSY